MLRTTALASTAVAGLAFIAGLDGAAVKPCHGLTDLAALE